MNRSLFHDRARPDTCARRCSVHLVLAVALAGLILGGLVPADSAEAKRKAGPRVEPELRILSVVPSSQPYSPQSGSLEFSIEVQLPRELGGAAILEVSSFLSSPSKRSMRFLSVRQPVHASGDGASSKMGITLTWDGMDQNKQPALGKYSYEIEAKLLSVGEKGPRTHMVAWPKRGFVEVK
jgi:hypothetical protein